MTLVNTYNMEHKGHATTLVNEIAILYTGRAHVTPQIRSNEYWTSVDLVVASFATRTTDAWNGVRLAVNEEGIINIFKMRYGSSTGDETKIIGNTSYAVLEATLNNYLDQMIGAN